MRYSKCARPRPWPLEWAKVKYKYTNRKAKHDFLFDDDSNICSISHRLRIICKSINMPKDLENSGQGKKRRETTLAPFDWKCSILY